MKKLKQKNLISTLLLVVLLISTFTLAGNFLYVLANPQNIAYLEQGVYPNAAAYTMWQLNSSYYAKDAFGSIPSWGITSNASALLINILGESPESLFIQAGNYYFNVTHTISAPIMVFGEGYSTHLYNSELAAMDYIFRVASDNVSFSNLRFAANPTSNMVCGIRINQHENTLIEKCYFINLRWAIMSNQEPTRTIVKDSYFEGGQEHQIFIYEPHDLTIINNHFRNLTYPCAWILAPSRTRIIGNNALDCAMNNINTAAFHVDAHNLGNTVDLIISGNFIKWWTNPDANSLGISVGSAQNGSNFAEQIVITENVIDGNTFSNVDFGIWIEGNASANNIRDIIVANNQIKHVDTYGIYAYRATNVEIYSNYIEDSGTNIFISATVINATVHHNVGFITENIGSGTFSSNTSITVNHGLDGTPNIVLASFNTTGWTSWGWSATSTQITITVQTSGTYECYWLAEYEPSG